MNPATRLTPKLLLLDLDGTLYVGDRPIPGAAHAITQVRNAGYQVRFLTNTTTKSHGELLIQLTALGFTLTPAELISAPMAAKLELLTEQQARGRPLRLWPLVASNLMDDFAEFIYDDLTPDFVVLGDIGERWNLNLINQLFNVIYQGAELIALHKNRFWQTAEGLKADIGLFVAGLEYVTHKPARVMGKPSGDFFARVLADAKLSAADAIVVGDDVDSDVAGAQALGMQAYLVKTGKFRPAYFASSGVTPDAVLDSIADLPAHLGIITA